MIRINTKKLLGYPIFISLAACVFNIILIYSTLAVGNSIVQSVCLSVFLVNVSVLIHELAHAQTAKILKMDVELVAVHLLGGFARGNWSERNYVKDMLVSLAGPASNILFALLLVYLNQFVTNEIVHSAFRLTITLSVIIAIFNLLPVCPFDGGQFFKSFCSLIIGDDKVGTYWAEFLGYFLSFLIITCACANFRLDVIWIMIGIYLIYEAKNFSFLERNRSLTSEQKGKYNEQIDKHLRREEEDYGKEKSGSSL